MRRKSSLYSMLRKLGKNLPAESLDDALRVEIEKHRNNPIASNSISGNPKYPVEYVSALIDRKWHLFRCLIPHKKDAAYNREAEAAMEIFPEMEGFLTEGLQASDNPVGPASGYASTVFALGTGVQYTLPFFGLQFDSETISKYENIHSILTSAAGAMGLIRGGRNAYRKWSKRKRTLSIAKSLSRTFKRLYGSKEPLVTRLKQLEEELPADENSYDSLREEIEKYRENPIVSNSISGNPNYPVEHVSEIYAKKWESAFTFFPRFIGMQFPHKKDAAYNQQVETVKEIFPDADGFVAQGMTAPDNPVSASIKYGAVAYALGKGIKVTLAAFGVDMGGEAGQNYDSVSESVASISGLWGLIRGSRNAYAKWSKRQRTEEQARWLSGLFSRMYK